MKNLTEIKEWAESISSSWNGDEPGIEEDRAHCASDILEKIAELEELIQSMPKLN